MQIWLFLFDISKLKPNLDIIDAELWAEALNPNNQVWTKKLPFCIFVNICAPTNYFIEGQKLTNHRSFNWQHSQLCTTCTTYYVDG